MKLTFKYGLWHLYHLLSYLIFVVSAVSSVHVKFLAECKKIPEERENYCFRFCLYRSSECIIIFLSVQFYTIISVLFNTLISPLVCNIYVMVHPMCSFSLNFVVILHLVYNSTLGVKFYTQCVMLHSV